MIAININLAGEGAAQDLLERGLKPIHLAEGAPAIRLLYLPKGMQSGAPSAAFVFELPGEKEFVVAETSVALLLMAAAAIRAKASTDGFHFE